jgi:hypothetical protein
MTARKYREGVSTRLMVARETLSNTNRQKFPLLIFNLDGVTGYWDEAKVYHMRSSILKYLVALSNNFRLVAVGIGQTKKCIIKLCN